MLGSIGQALRDARLKKNLTVEEVARVTKIRAARIVDLERDDYTRFPNITYARSFLLLYAKHLGVDISKYPTVEVGSTVGLGDYQYLQSDGTPNPPRTRAVPPAEKPRWILPFCVFLVMLAVGALIGWGIMEFRRLGSVENLVKKDAGVVATPSPVPSATPTPSPTPTPAPSPAEAQEMEIPVPPPLSLPPTSSDRVASPTPQPEVRRAEPLTSGSSDAALLAEVAATPTPSPVPAAFPPEGAVREIKVRVTKRIKVRIVRDNAKSSAAYYGYMNQAMAPQVFRGKYFWIKTTDPDALQITIDGQPVTGPESGVEISRVSGL